MPLPVALGAPVQFLVVEGYITHLAADRVDELTNQLVSQVTRKEKEFIGLLPDIRLVDTNPVGLSFSLQVGNGFAHAGDLEQSTPNSTQRFLARSTALIQPVDSRAQGLASLVDINQRRALRGQGYPNDCLLIHTRHQPKLLAGLTNRLPEYFGVLLSIARLGRVVGLDRNLRFRHQITMQIKNQSAYGLCAIINCQQLISRHLKPPGFYSSVFLSVLWSYPGRAFRRDS